MKLKEIKAEVYERGQYLVTFKDKRTKARQLAALEQDNYGCELHTRFLDGSELWCIYGERAY
jgi:hypothetical protein